MMHVKTTTGYDVIRDDRENVTVILLSRNAAKGCVMSELVPLLPVRHALGWQPAVAPDGPNAIPRSPDALARLVG